MRKGVEREANSRRYDNRYRTPITICRYNITNEMVHFNLTAHVLVHVSAKEVPQAQHAEHASLPSRSTEAARNI